jgi:hypothetical protein
MGSLLSDIRLAVRRLATAPGFFATAVLTLALGMGVNALLFSAVNGLLLRPIPLVDVDSIVWLFAESTETPGVRETVRRLRGQQAPLMPQRPSATRRSCEFSIASINAGGASGRLPVSSESSASHQSLALCPANSRRTRRRG